MTDPTAPPVLLNRRVRLGSPKDTLPVKGHGKRRVLSVTLTDQDAEALERLRVVTGEQSWGAVIRRLIQGATR